MRRAVAVLALLWPAVAAGDVEHRAAGLEAGQAWEVLYDGVPVDVVEADSATVIFFLTPGRGPVEIRRASELPPIPEPMPPSCLTLLFRSWAAWWELTHGRRPGLADMAAYAERTAAWDEAFGCKMVERFRLLLEPVW